MKYIFLIAFTLFTFSGIQAQDGRRERIKSLKIAYLTENLALTPEEAQKFWPVYNAHEETIYNLKVVEMGDIRRRLRTHGMESLTEAEASRMLDRIQDLEKTIFEQENKFRKELRTIISPKRVIFLEILEEKFKRELLRKLQHKRGGKDRK